MANHPRRALSLMGWRLYFSTVTDNSPIAEHTTILLRYHAGNRYRSRHAKHRFSEYTVTAHNRDSLKIVLPTV